MFLRCVVFKKMFRCGQMVDCSTFRWSIQQRIVPLMLFYLSPNQPCLLTFRHALEFLQSNKQTRQAHAENSCLFGHVLIKNYKSLSSWNANNQNPNRNFTYNFILDRLLFHLITAFPLVILPEYYFSNL